MKATLLAYEDLYNIFKIHRSYFEQETETLELIDFLLEVYQKNVKGV